MRVLLPSLVPGMMTGFALAFARGLGEYGSVVFVVGNLPFKSEIAPVLIVAQLDDFRYAEATAVAVMLLAGSFTALGIINWLEARNRRYAS
jgi:sulfate transport system permease protein